MKKPSKKLDFSKPTPEFEALSEQDKYIMVARVEEIRGITQAMADAVDEGIDLGEAAFDHCMKRIDELLVQAGINPKDFDKWAEGKRNA